MDLVCIYEDLAKEIVTKLGSNWHCLLRSEKETTFRVALKTPVITFVYEGSLSKVVVLGKDNYTKYPCLRFKFRQENTGSFSTEQKLYDGILFLGGSVSQINKNSLYEADSVVIRKSLNSFKKDIWRVLGGYAR